MPSTAIRALAQDAENDGERNISPMRVLRLRSDSISLLQHHVFGVPMAWRSSQVEPPGSDWRNGALILYHLAMVSHAP